MDTEQIKQSAKTKWLDYYKTNRHWINDLQVWMTNEGIRRPLSSFILGVLSSIDLQLVKMLPLLVDLNSDPDRLILALGLNFDPDQELEKINNPPPEKKEQKKMLPPSSNSSISEMAIKYANQVDGNCEGVFTTKKKGRLPFEP